MNKCVALSLLASLSTADDLLSQPASYVKKCKKKPIWCRRKQEISWTL